MQRCLRSSFFSVPLSYPRHTRLIHPTSIRQTDRSFTDETPNINSLRLQSSQQDSAKRHADQIAYADLVSDRGFRRWQESQEPKGKLQFMSMGREFTIPYNLTQLANQNLNHLRELRAYYRKIMYEMPQFKQFARPFRPPNKFQVLRFRYTSYLGENHPAAKKVVLMVKVKKLREALQSDPRIDDAWEHKFKLLCGPRYHPETDTLHMSCDQFPYPAQNKRWLSNKIDELVNAAATGESYSDIPIDTRHVKKSRIHRIPKSWLRLSPERHLAEKSVEEEIYIPALTRCVELAKVPSLDALPKQIKKRLRGIVNATVRHAVRPGFYADLNDPQVREMIIVESLKHLVWSFKGVEAPTEEFITPDLSEEVFEREFKAEQERIAKKEKEENLRAEEDRREQLYNAQQEYAVSNVAEEIPEVTAAELKKAEEQLSELAEEKDTTNLGVDETMTKALKQREERRKLILSRLDEPDVPEWLKHAVDSENTEYFPMASGRFSAEKSREELLAEFFQKELDDAPHGSEQEAKLLEELRKIVDNEDSGRVEQENVESIKKRVNAMLKEIERNDRK